MNTVQYIPANVELEKGQGKLLLESVKKKQF